MLHTKVTLPWISISIMTEVPSYPSPVTTHSETMLQPSQESSLPNLPRRNPNIRNTQNHTYTDFDEKEEDSSSSSIADFEKDDPRFENGASQLPLSAGPILDSVPTESDEESDTSGDLEKQAVHDDRIQKDSSLVEWNGPNDPENPMNWSRGRKWLITLAMGSMTWVITFASSVFSTATIVTAHEFHTSEEVMILGTSLFVLVRLRITWSGTAC